MRTANGIQLSGGIGLKVSTIGKVKSKNIRFQPMNRPKKHLKSSQKEGDQCSDHAISYINIVFLSKKRTS